MTDAQRAGRNIAIVVALGAAVYFIPGGGHVAAAFEAFLWAMFALGIAFLGLRLYRENTFRLSALGDRHRGLLYGGDRARRCSASWRAAGCGKPASASSSGSCSSASPPTRVLEVYRHFRSYS